MNKEQKKKAENYIFYPLLASTVVIFIISPAYIDPNNRFDHMLNNLIDHYLLGNGYYSPTYYPFAAKITNSFSVVLAIIAGVFVGILRKDGIEYVSKSLWFACLVMLGLGIATFFLSLNPQEFREPTFRRSFGTSESFHNNPVLFLFMMIVKQVCIYAGIRVPLSLMLYYIDKIRK
ncbi:MULTISPECIES: hypothetical protein [Neisseria]|uniref:Uncharacterized protein n=1 Tax=Neisseria dumasiana TaxID=1931275 RepID=A0A1X3DJE4_9NEIS|nr:MULTISPECIES: hypothetical protein [Neisseria]KPN73978.1 hypothetical protein AKG43_05260 [Neisseria sp. 74A18]OSI23569.1 hypothetical protein BV912_03955 [Neisseria dumasiana]